MLQNKTKKHLIDIFIKCLPEVILNHPLDGTFSSRPVESSDTSISVLVYVILGFSSLSLALASKVS